MIYIFIFFLNLFISTSIFGEEIEIIELHNKVSDTILIDSAKKNSNIEENFLIDSTEDNSNQSGKLLSSNNLITIESKNENGVIAYPDFWERSNKDEIIFLLDNIVLTNSKILNNILIDSLLFNSLPPANLTQDEFNRHRVLTLIRLGQKNKAFKIISSFDDINNDDFYNLFKLNHYFSSYELNLACDFNDSIDKKKSLIDKNFLLKVDIFCSFIRDKIDEADFLISLLNDIEDQDEYFQKIYTNLKNENNQNIEIKNYKHDLKSLALYSAILRVGDMPLSNHFLDYDPSNLSMPIVLSDYSDFSIRLQAAHLAYRDEYLTSESLSALYQSVDFKYDELLDLSNAAKKIDNKPEMKMAYFYQKANIQILPITRIQTLIEFWNFADNENLKLLAYDVSRNLIDSIEPSSELAEYGLDIIKAHIYNDNFELAKKWILFVENYQSSEDSSFPDHIHAIKLLYDLKNTKIEEDFSNILFNDFFKENEVLLNKISKDRYKIEIILTISSIIGNSVDSKFTLNRSITDERQMPSRYILNKIKASALEDNLGEFILGLNLSIGNKKWNEIHPEHLKIILSSIKDLSIDSLFEDIIIEILEDSEII